MESHSRIKLFFLFCLCFNSLLLHSAVYNTLSDGKWVDERQKVWGNGGNAMPPYAGALNNGDVINIYHVVSLDHDLDGKNGFFLNIQDGAKLTINGNFEAGNNIKIKVFGSGELIINGNFEANNGASVHIEGNVNVLGNMHFHNNSSINLEGGDLQVGGDLCGHIKGNGNGLYIYGDEDSSIRFGSICIDGDGSVDIDGPLPIELITFSFRIQQNNIILFWSTATEINNMGFEVQRMHQPGDQWEPIGWVDGHYNYNGILHYEYQDPDPVRGVNYYRLRQVDYDGAFEYHGPVAALFDPDITQKDFTAYRDATSLNITLEGHEQSTVEVYDLSGRKLVSRQAVHRLSLPAPQKPLVVRVIYGPGQSLSKIVR